MLKPRHPFAGVFTRHFLNGITEVSSTDLCVSTRNKLQDSIMDENILVLYTWKVYNDNELLHQYGSNYSLIFPLTGQRICTPIVTVELYP